MFIPEEKNHTRYSEERSFTLQDFIIAWIKHWKLFVFIIFLSLTSGILYSKTRPPKPFLINTTIEIGLNENGTPLESLDRIQTKLTNAYIPTILGQHALNNGYDVQRYWIDVKIPENGFTVLLQSYGDEVVPNDLLELHEKVAEILIKDQTELVASMKQKLEQDKLIAELALESLKEETQLLPQKKETINRTTDIAKKQIQALQQLINNNEEDRRRALTTASSKDSFDQSLATAFLLLDNTISKNREKLLELEEQLFIKIPEQLKKVDQEEFELLRKQREQEQKIRNLSYKIENFRTTRILLNPSRLPRVPESSLLHQTVAIFTGVGFLLGLFLVAFVEFVSQIQQKKKKEISS